MSAHTPPFVTYVTRKVLVTFHASVILTATWFHSSEGGVGSCVPLWNATARNSINQLSIFAQYVRRFIDIFSTFVSLNIRWNPTGTVRCSSFWSINQRRELFSSFFSEWIEYLIRSPSLLPCALWGGQLSESSGRFYLLLAVWVDRWSQQLMIFINIINAKKDLHVL